MTSGSVAIVRYHGSSRSLVRCIASKLPIDPGQRLLIQLPHGTSSVPSSPLHSLTGHFDSPGDGLTLASFLRDPGPILNKATNRLHSISEEVSGRDDVEEGGETSESEINVDLEGGLEMSQQGTDDHPEVTAKKISALESELARLKSQIASYALSEMQQNVQDSVAPPPPPPPPLRVVSDKPSLPSDQTTDVSSERSSAPTHPTSAAPSMGSVLQGLGSVKLRAVEKSPGGTPMRKKPLSREPSVDDPAAIIASALRKKFSHRVFQDSPDKENLNRSESSFTEFNSPAVKLF